MSAYTRPFKAVALAGSLFLCPVWVSAQAPSDADIAAVEQYRGPQAMPDADSIENAQKQLAVPSGDQLNARMNRLREATEKALKDPSLQKLKGPVPQEEYQRATQSEREDYLSNVQNETRKAMSAHTAKGLDSLPSVIERYQNEQNRALRRMESDVPDVPEDAVLVFVSFSMPDNVLSALAKQARIVGATLVLRGMKSGSLHQTKDAALAVNRAGAAWQINPGLFESFGVKSVPTFVVTGNKEVLDHGCPLDAADSCSLSGSYTSVSGDLSIELALQTIRLRTDIPYVRNLADDRLTRLKADRKG